MAILHFLTYNNAYDSSICVIPSKLSYSTGVAVVAASGKGAVVVMVIYE